MPEKYIVRLTAEERKELTALIRKGKASAAKIRHAHLLLKADADGPTDSWRASANLHWLSAGGARATPSGGGLY